MLWAVRRLLLLLALAALCGTTLWSRVFVEFVRARVRITETTRLAAASASAASAPVPASTLDLTIPEDSHLSRLSPPFIIGARVQNPGREPLTVHALLNGMDLGSGSSTVSAGTQRRLEWELGLTRAVRSGDVLTFVVRDPPASAADPVAWSITSADVANYYGSARLLIPMFVVPATTSVSASPHPLAIVIITGAIVFLVGTTGFNAWARPVRIIYIIAATIAILIFVLSLASVTLSGYKVLLSPKAFLLCALALTWPGLWQYAQQTRAYLERRGAWLLATLDAAIVALVVMLFYVMLAQSLLADYDGNYSGFLQMSRRFGDQVPALSHRPDLLRDLQMGDGGGYDGQFIYAIMFDPLLLAFRTDPSRYRAVVDAPPYRFARIGFPLIAKVLSGNVPELYPRTIVWTILASTFAGAFLLACIARFFGHSPLLALAYIAVPGFVQSLHVALPEPTAAAFLILGYVLLLHRRIGWAVTAFAASVLIRETGIIFVLALALWDARRESTRRTAWLLCLALVPYLAWRGYVGWRLWSDFGWQGVFFNPQNLGWPFAGIAQLWQRIYAGQYFDGDRALAIAGIAFPALLLLGLGISVYALRHRRDGLALAAVAYAGLAISLNYEAIWLHVGNAERGTYEFFLATCMMLVSYDATSTDRRVTSLLIALLSLTAMYTLLGSVDAPLIRYSVFS
jgi:hypothetical protein